MTKKVKTSKQLATEHWDWIRGLLDIQYESGLKLQEKLFKDGFIHGYKHGQKQKSLVSSDEKPIV